MAGRYTFFDMLKDVVFNGNKVSGSERNNETEDNDYRGSNFSSSSTSSKTSGEFDPSDAAGEGFRSVFGDDN